MSEVVFSPVESVLQGYFIIPGFSKNLISREGVAICRETGEVVSQHTSTEYNYTFVYSDKHDKNLIKLIVDPTPWKIPDNTTDL